MSNKDLWRKPHNVSKNFWWYEESFGVSVVVQDPISKNTTVNKISWRAIRNALRRKDKK
jgi:hypothetical protein